MTPEPERPAPEAVTLAAVGESLVAVVDAIPGVRLWVAPPFDRLPPRLGRVPAGIKISTTAVHLHLAVTTPDILHLTGRLGDAVAAALAGGPCDGAEIHLHVERVERVTGW